MAKAAQSDNRPRGKKHHNAKLNEKTVKSIKDKIKKGDSQAELARKYGVTPQAINSIASGRTWSHVR